MRVYGRLFISYLDENTSIEPSYDNAVIDLKEKLFKEEAYFRINTDFNKQAFLAIRLDKKITNILSFRDELEEIFITLKSNGLSLVGKLQVFSEEPFENISITVDKLFIRITPTVDLEYTL